MNPAAYTMKEKDEHIAQTVKENSSRLLRFIKRFVGRAEEAEDILQDVFYQFVIGYDQIKSLDQIGSWLFRVARNKATDNHRKMRPASFSELNKESDHDEALSLADILPDTGNLPDRELLGEVIWSRIDELLAEMPDAQRQVFVWHEFEQKSFKEMASETGETVNTLISRKRYAILYLREGLATLYKELINDE